MSVLILKDASGNSVTVTERGSCDLTFAFYDLSGDPLVKASLSTIALTLREFSTGEIVNGRDSQDIKDANNGTVDTDGTTTVKLSPDDHTNLATVRDDVETREGVLTWTWTDADGDSRTGKQIFRYGIRTFTTSNRSGPIEIVRGDSYDGTANDKITWPVTKDFTGWTGTMTIRHRITNTELLSVSVTVSSATLLSASLSIADTAFPLLVDNEEFGFHPYDVEMVNGSNEQTPIVGTAKIVKDSTIA